MVSLGVGKPAARAAQASDAALTTASIERKWTNGFSIAGTSKASFPMSPAATQAKAWSGMRGEQATFDEAAGLATTRWRRSFVDIRRRRHAHHRRLFRGRATARRPQGGDCVMLHENRTAVVHVVAVGRLARDFGHDLGLQARPAFVGENKRRLGLKRIAWPVEPGDDGGRKLRRGANDIAVRRFERHGEERRRVAVVELVDDQPAGLPRQLWAHRRRMYEAIEPIAALLQRSPLGVVETATECVKSDGRPQRHELLRAAQRRKCRIILNPAVGSRSVTDIAL